MEPRQIYGLFMFLALAVFVLARHYQPKTSSAPRLPWWQQAALGLAAFVGGTLGAKACFALFDEHAWSTFKDWVIAWTSDGKTITVGLASGYLAVELTKLALGIRVKTGDGFALPLALAMAVGRWGCFFNGCCFGTETSLPWGVAFPIDDYATRRHPTQLYESLFHLGMAGVLYELIRRDLLRYQRLKFCLISYCVYRFVTEFIRPEPIWWLGLTFYQWVSIGLASGLTIHWIRDSGLSKRGSALGDNQDPVLDEKADEEQTSKKPLRSDRSNSAVLVKKKRLRFRLKRVFFDILFIFGLIGLVSFCGIFIENLVSREYVAVGCMAVGLVSLFLFTWAITDWQIKQAPLKAKAGRSLYNLLVAIGVIYLFIFLMIVGLDVVRHFGLHG
jgi:phosphatidylglycerol---prolipoprotein diacylglyceryl transferase